MTAYEVTAIRDDDNATTITFTTTVRIDATPEWEYYRHGEILHYMVRDLADLVNS